MSLKNRAICACLMLLCGIIFSAQAGTVADDFPREIPNEALAGFRLDTITSTYIWFRHDVEVVDSNYMENRASLAALRSAVAEIGRDSLNSISSIIVEGSSSPLGHEIYNLQLSYRRAQTVENFLRGLPGIGGGIDIQLAAKGEDWDAFTQDIRDNYQRRNRKEVLELLESDLTNQEKKTRLRTMEPDSLTWRILIRDNMNSSRHAVAIVVVKKSRHLEILPYVDDGYISDCFRRHYGLHPVTADMAIGPSVLPSVSKPDAVQDHGHEPEQEPDQEHEPEHEPDQELEQEPDRIPEPEIVQKSDRKQDGQPVLFSLRSNLLVPALNIGAEYPIGTDWSVGADYYFPWIMRNADHRNCFQLLGWNVEGRYWFGKDRTAADVLKGHSVGLNAAVGYYDIERNFKGNQGTFVSVGADYLYAMPVFDNKIHLEFTVGLGYIFSQMRPYEVFEEGGNAFKLGYKKNFNWVGPTKAAVTIVVPIRPEMLKWMRRKDR